MTQKEIEKRERLRKTKPLAYNKVMKYDDKLNNGESVAVVQLQYSYRCNFHCKHCSISKQQDVDRRTLTPQDVKAICDQADAYGLAQIDFTGGEPLSFPDLDEVCRAIGMDRFHVMCDSNGWLMTQDRAKHLKELGFDRVQLSLDSKIEDEHDTFRRCKGSYARVMSAIDYCFNAGLTVQLSTVITKERVYSNEFRDFLRFVNTKGCSINAISPKLIGEWEGRKELLLSEEELKHVDELGVEFNLPLVHNRTKHFDRDYGCIAVKKVISITAYGDVNPCIWTNKPIGNIFNTPLEEIMKKGMKEYGDYSGCRLEAK